MEDTDQILTGPRTRAQRGDLQGIAVGYDEAGELRITRTTASLTPAELETLADELEALASDLRRAAQIA